MTKMPAVHTRKPPAAQAKVTVNARLLGCGIATGTEVSAKSPKMPVIVSSSVTHKRTGRQPGSTVNRLHPDQQLASAKRLELR